ncbi:MAG: hypothetical protein KJ734_08880, partial [Chloroflexi bacterium]|nr:hypothetical protein [Chloroflexota bacterium]
MQMPPASIYVPTVPSVMGPAERYAPTYVTTGAYPQMSPTSGPPHWPASGGSWSLVSFNPATAPVVRVNGLWLLPETVQAQPQAPWSRSPLTIARAAVDRGRRRMTALRWGLLTQHALLVACGEFAHEIGLLQKLSQVPIPHTQCPVEKSVEHTPQAKVLTFLLGILTGIKHLKD